MTSQEQIKKFNCIIAEFMGAVREEKYGKEIVYTFPEGFAPEKHSKFGNVHIDSIQYHYDWAWLGTVVEKICSLSFMDGEPVYFRTFGIRTGSGQYAVRIERHSVQYGETMLEAVFNAVFQFIERLNQTFVTPEA